MAGFQSARMSSGLALTETNRSMPLAVIAAPNKAPDVFPDSPYPAYRDAGPCSMMVRVAIILIRHDVSICAAHNRVHR